MKYEAVADVVEYEDVPRSDPVTFPIMDPVTTNEPDIIALPVYGNVVVDEALSAYEAVSDVFAKLLLTDCKE